MTVMIGGHSALGKIRVDQILYTYPNGVYFAQIPLLIVKLINILLKLTIMGRP